LIAPVADSEMVRFCGASWASATGDCKEKAISASKGRRGLEEVIDTDRFRRLPARGEHCAIAGECAT
jgi:hypothetical protein